MLSTHLYVGKVHFRMLLLELLQNVQLLLFVTGGLACLLLSLIVHHLLDHASRLAIQIPQFAVFWLDLAGVDLGCRGDDMGPPFHLIDLVQVHLDVLAGGCWGECPGRLVDADWVGEVTLHSAVSGDCIVSR